MKPHESDPLAVLQGQLDSVVRSPGAHTRKIHAQEVSESIGEAIDRLAQQLAEKNGIEAGKQQGVSR